jgi:hypothetical protein
MTEPAASRFEIGGEPHFPLRHPRSPVHNARRLALDVPSMRDPKVSRSETAGLVGEMMDETATKSAKTVKKSPSLPPTALRLTLRARAPHLTLDRNHEY